MKHTRTNRNVGASSKSRSKAPRSGSHKSLKSHYTDYFTPTVSPLWRNDRDDFSLEQPSPLKPVPTETSYGVDGVFRAVSVA